MMFTTLQHSLSILLFYFNPAFSKPGLVVPGRWLCRCRDRHIGILTIIAPPRIIKMMIFTTSQHSLLISLFKTGILKTEPGGDRQVAVPVPGPALACNMYWQVIR
jgi:hypothetical protein